MFALIAWIGRFLLIMFVVRLVLRLFTPSPARTGPATNAGPRPRGPFGARTPQPERVGGQLVRCEQCGTYVPASGAINGLRNGVMQHFCSIKCRDEFVAAHP